MSNLTARKEDKAYGARLPICREHSQAVCLEINDGTVYLRKDYSEIVRTSEQSEKVTYWTYQEAQITTQEFNEYVNMLMAQNAIKGQNDSENIVSLMVGQENNDSNQLAVMEAIADLYEMLLPM